MCMRAWPSDIGVAVFHRAGGESELNSCTGRRARGQRHGGKRPIQSVVKHHFMPGIISGKVKRGVLEKCLKSLLGDTPPSGFADWRESRLLWRPLNCDSSIIRFTIALFKGRFGWPQNKRFH